jgi:hypothetical protein
MKTIVALAIALISASPAQAAIAPVAIDRLAEQLREAHYARIGIEAQTLLVVKPRVALEGLAYESVRGYPKPRPAIVVEGGWDSIPPPPNPVPWDRIDQIEAGMRTRRPGRNHRRVARPAHRDPLGIEWRLVRSRTRARRVAGRGWSRNWSAVSEHALEARLPGARRVGEALMQCHRDRPPGWCPRGHTLRTIRVVLVLSILLASVSPIRAATGPIPTERLAQRLREAHYARIGLEGQTYLLVKPLVEHDGLGFKQIKGPPERPAIVAGADSDSIALHRNPVAWSGVDRIGNRGGLPRSPVAWSRIDRIETGVQTQPGVKIGALVGLLYGIGLATGLTAWSAYAGEPLEGRGVIIAGSGAVFSILGAGIGALFPTTRWKQVYPEPNEAQHASALPIPTTLLEQQLREADDTRIGIGGDTFTLINPQVGVEGLAYESIPGLPKRRPAIVAGADWDSVAMPSNPIPLSRIDRVETGIQSGRHGAKVGGTCGLLFGLGVGTTLIAYNGVPTEGGVGGIVVGSVVTGIVGALVGSLFESTRWTQVYPPKAAAER